MMIEKNLTEFSTFELARIKKLIRNYMEHYRLDLKNLTVLTEAASGYYLFTPLICSIANAKKVYAIAKDSEWGRADDIKRVTYNIANKFETEKNIEIVHDINPREISESDIIMNMKFVRPINNDMIKHMKKTAVIPLMWETWEVRPHEIDLKACKDFEILVMGTDECKLSMFEYAGYLAWHLLNQRQIEVYKNSLFLISSGRVAEGICKVLSNNEIDYHWSSYDKIIPDSYHKCFIDPRNKEKIIESISTVDAMIIAEHVHNLPLIGKKGIITPIELSKANKEIIIIYLGGLIDYKGIRDLSLEIYPDKKVSFGTFTTYSYVLGPRAVLELNIAGLKVAEAMARARLEGYSLEESKKYAMNHSPAMDF